jgi:hypothetical protein
MLAIKAALAAAGVCLFCGGGGSGIDLASMIFSAAKKNNSS